MMLVVSSLATHIQYLSIPCCRSSIKKILASTTSTVEMVQRSAKQKALREKNERSRGNILLAKEESARLSAEKGSFLRSSLHASTSRANMMLEAEAETRRSQRDRRSTTPSGSSTLVIDLHTLSSPVCALIIIGRIVYLIICML